MRTTIRLSDELLQAAKSRALETRRTLTAVIEDALRASLARPVSSPNRNAEQELPVGGRGGLLPGVDLDDSAAVLDLMDGLR